MQVGKPEISRFRQQLSVNAIRLGSGHVTQSIDRSRVHRVDANASRQQESDEQPMICFHDAGQFFWVRGKAPQKLLQVIQASRAVRKATCSNRLAAFIQDSDVMMRVCPIQTNIPHCSISFVRTLPGRIGSLYNQCSKQRPSNHRCTQESCQGKVDLVLSVEPCEGGSLSPAVLLSRGEPAQPLFERANQNLTI